MTSWPNYGYQLGQGVATHSNPTVTDTAYDQMTRFVPVRVKGGEQNTDTLERVISISAGEAHSVALTLGDDLQSREVFVWGSYQTGSVVQNDASTSLGANRYRRNYMVARTPVKIDIPNGVVISKVSAGDIHDVAMSDAGAVYAWGANCNGALGNGVGANSGVSADEIAWSMPVNRVLSGVAPQENVNGIDYLTGVLDISAGSNSTLVSTVNGYVYALSLIHI